MVAPLHGLYGEAEAQRVILLSSADGGDTYTAVTNPATGTGGGGGAGVQYVEDAVAAADPTGTAVILVRKDTPSATVSTDGDNVAQRGTNFGAAYVTLLDSSGNPVAVGGGTQYTEDAVSAADPIGTMQIARRRDAPASEVSTDGDNIAVNATAKGEQYVKHLDTIGVTGTFWQATQPVSGSVTADTELPAAAALADAIANPTVPSVGAENLLFNGTTWDRVRGDITNGTDVDVTRLPALVAGAADIGGVNLTKVAGTAPDVNSGVKSAGTLRVVLATDQPQLTAKLLVTPDSVALPANQSMNMAQVAGTATDVNSGNKSAGTQRTVIATDQPQLTTPLNVAPMQVRITPAAPTISTSGYISGDQISTAITFTAAASASGRAGQVVEATLMTATVAALNPLKLLLFEVTPTLASADNAGLSITAANMVTARHIGRIDFLAADYDTHTSGAICKGTMKAGPVSIGYVTSGSANIFGVLVCSGAPAAQYGTTTDITVSLVCNQY